MLPRQGGVRLVRWRTSRGSPTAVLGAGRLWRYQSNPNVCGWCNEEQTNDHQLWRGVDAENAPHGGFVGAQTVSFSDAAAKLLCDLKWIKQSHALKITHSLPFFLDATEQSHSFLSTCWDPYTIAWRSLLLQHEDRFWGTPLSLTWPQILSSTVRPLQITFSFFHLVRLLQITFHLSSLGEAFPDHFSPSFTWCDYSGKIYLGCRRSLLLNGSHFLSLLSAFPPLEISFPLLVWLPICSFRFNKVGMYSL